MKKEVAYQNKDICSKIFAEKLAGKSFQVYGVDLPKIKQVLPTNLPAIQANELRMDNLFLLEDDSFLLVDYESAYKEENKLKYLEYILRVLKIYQTKYGLNMKIRLLVIYTTDVSRENVSSILDVYSLKMELSQAFLSELDSKTIKETIIEKIKQKKPLTETELMQTIILPLTYKGETKKKESIKELFELMKEIKEEETQLFLLSGILVFTDKVIDKETAKQIKEWIRMTKVARLYEEEKIEAVNEAVTRTIQQKEKEKEKAIQQKEKEKERAIHQMVKKMLEKNVDILNIMEITGLTKKMIEKIQQEVIEPEN